MVRKVARRPEAYEGQSAYRSLIGASDMLVAEKSTTRKSTKGLSKIHGGAIIAEMLAAEDVSQVFGIIDGTYFGLYSNFEPNGISLVTPRHESCAAHMAGAYARLSGGLGVCIASNGPGVAAMLPGVAVENAEGNRVLLITSSRRPSIIHPDRGGTFQCFPHVDVIRPMAKWSCAVPSLERLAELMRRALRECFTGRPGVVHLDVPETILNAKVKRDPRWFRAPKTYRATTPLEANAGQLEEAARRLLSAKQPMIQAGSGVVHAKAYAALERVAGLLSAPVTTSWAARCAIDERCEQAISMVYIDEVNRTRTESDLILNLGSRLGESDWWGKAPYWGTPDKQGMIQVDIDPGNLGRIRETELPIQADVGSFLTALAAKLEELGPPANMTARQRFVGDLRKRCAKQRKKLDKKLEDMSSPMHSAHVPSIIREETGDDAVLVIDGGNTAVWTNFYSEVRQPGTILGTPKMGMLGAGVPQALGAKAARPDSQVTCVIGDGAMGYYLQEIETAIRNELAVTYVVLCDRQWGMVKMNQQFTLKPIKTLLRGSLSAEETINADLEEIRFDELAQAFGAIGERVSDPAGFRAAIKRAGKADRCTVIHVDVDRVKHMWAPHLKTFKDMHQEPKGA